LRERQIDEGTGGTEGKMQRGLWMSSALGLVMAVMVTGWVFYQAKEFPGVKKLTTSDSTTPPLFDISYMRADLYLHAHEDGYDKYRKPDRSWQAGLRTAV
jgi:hypothetical protein